MRSNLLVAALGATVLALPAMAHPHPQAGEKSEQVIIMTTDATDADAKKGGVRAFRMHPEGGMNFADCDGDKTEIQEGTGKEKTRIFICGKPGLSGEERAKKLEEVRSRLAKNDRLSGEHRSRVDAALQEAINRARSSK